MPARIRTSALAVASVLTIASATTALAHGDAHEGQVSVVIGFGSEPAYAGLPNSVQVLLEHDGEPVVDATGVAVEVTYGDQSITYDLEPTGEPGDYRAFFVPSEPGPYTFHVRGEVEGEQIDAEMTSGPDTFAEVESLTEAAFPPVDVPSADDLAARLESESERVTAASEAAVAAEQNAASARSIALIAMVVGAIGVIAAIAALAASRRTGE